MTLLNSERLSKADRPRNEVIIWNSGLVYKWTGKDFLACPHQSGFTHGDSTIDQLLFLFNEISQALDSGKEIRIVFFDISKAFDRVWYKGLLLKLKSFEIGGSFLGWIKDYLSFFRKQKVIIKSKESTLRTINAGVPQG